MALGSQALGRRALGQATTDHAISADYGSVALTSTDITFAVTMPADYGSVTLTGQDAILTYSSGLHLFADVGSVTLTGQESTFGVGLPVVYGSFSVSGQASARRLSLIASVGTFARTGQTITPRRDLRLYAFSYASSTTQHSLFAPLGSIAIGQGSTSNTTATTFSLTGQSASFVVAATLTAAVGTYTLTMSDAFLASSTYPDKIRIFPRVGRGPRGVRLGGGMAVRSSSGSGTRIKAFGG